jgi:hypothetical protein
MEKASSCKRELAARRQTEALRPNSKTQGNNPTESQMELWIKMEQQYLAVSVMDSLPSLSS